jgi:DnaK suppressor protein
MNEKNLERFKRRLTEWQAELIRQSGSVRDDLRTYDMHQPDGCDLAVEEGGLAFALRIRGRESRLILKIERALRDIEEGEYGICEVCGRDIGLKRLEARPVTRHCIRCKTELERQERMRY